MAFKKGKDYDFIREAMRLKFQKNIELASSTEGEAYMKLFKTAAEAIKNQKGKKKD